MLKVRTVCFALLIPLLLELMVYCTALSPRTDRETRVIPDSEQDRIGFQRLEEPRGEAEEDDSSFGGLQTASHLSIKPMVFQSLEIGSLQSFALPVRAIGWMMPLRI
jgi:hypothetical protein